MGDITKLRLSLQAAGFSPLPALGKKVLLSEWSAMTCVTPEQIALWDTEFPAYQNTSLLCRSTPFLDSDITQADAAEAVDEFVRDWFDGRGVLLRRIGQAPKFAIPFRTETPFTKRRVEFEAPDGSAHGLEFLGDGQQIISHGVHPETTNSYKWHAGREPGVIRRDELPEIDETEADALMAAIAELLERDFDFKQIRDNGSAHGHAVVKDGNGKIDVEASLSGMHDGGSVNAIQPSVIASLLNHMHPDGVSAKVVDATMLMAERCKLVDKKGKAWTRDTEVKEVRKRILWAYNNVLTQDYDPATDGIPTWLAEEFHASWAERTQKGRKPVFGFNRSGFYIRSEQGSAGPEVASKPSSSSNTSFVIKPFKPFDVSKLPPRQWLLGDHHRRGAVSSTVAPGGTGKTTLVMVEAVSLGSGRRLLDETPRERVKVWLHNGEEPYVELQRRVAGICQYYEIPQEELDGWLHLTSGAEMPLKVANGYADLKIDRTLVEQITVQAQALNIGMMAFDPLVTVHSVSENDNGKMDQVVRVFAGIAAALNCAIDLSQHTRKPAAGFNELTANDARGASAVHDAVRAQRVLNIMSPQEAEENGIDKTVGRLSYFRVDRGKGNSSRPAKTTVWRKFESVALANGDDVGVVTPTTIGQGPPSEERQKADRLAEDTYLACLDKLTAQGRDVSAKKGAASAPHIFANMPENKHLKIGKRQFEAAEERLRDKGAIKDEPYGPASRGTRRIVRTPKQGL